MVPAIGVEPTNDTAAIPGWARIASTACLSPCTTLNTPSGSPASLNSSAMRTEAEGSFSEGLSTKLLPQAIATGNIHSGTITGKLNGGMPAHTPSGWRSECVSTWVPTFSECSPLSRCGMPQANSTTSMPRCTEPSASGSVLPCSSVTILASCFWFACSSCRNFCITRARRSGGVSRQPGYAAAAAFTAASTARGTQHATRPAGCPRPGVKNGPPPPPAPRGRERPPVHPGGDRVELEIGGLVHAGDFTRDPHGRRPQTLRVRLRRRPLGGELAGRLQSLDQSGIGAERLVAAALAAS